MNQSMLLNIASIGGSLKPLSSILFGRVRGFVFICMLVNRPADSPPRSGPWGDIGNMAGRIEARDRL